MESNNIENQRKKHAIDKVKKLKSFYIHFLIYMFVNLIVFIKNIQDLEPDESYFQVHNFIIFGIWGIVILIQALSVFIPTFIFGSEWEARKIKQYMQKEEKYQQWD